jgi:hypothetical protein
MGKVKSLMAALGREQGSMRKIASSKLTSEWEVRCDMYSMESAL